MSAGAGGMCCSLKGCQGRSSLGLGLKGIRGSREGLAELEVLVGSGVEAKGGVSGARSSYGRFGGSLWELGCPCLWKRVRRGPDAWLIPRRVSLGSTGLLPAWPETRPGRGNPRARSARGPFKRLCCGPFKGRVYQAPALREVGGACGGGRRYPAWRERGWAVGGQ